MTFPIPSAWQPLSHPTPVHPRMVIVAGDGAHRSHLGAVVQDDRLLRAEVMPAAGWADDDPVELGVSNAGFPSSGGQTWLRTLPWRTRKASTGTLLVAAWLRNTNAGGGLNVAVQLPNGTPVANVTLTNTTSATLEELEDEITGLTAETDYVLIVRGAGNGTSTGEVLGLRIEDEALDASTIA